MSGARLVTYARDTRCSPGYSRVMQGDIREIYMYDVYGCVHCCCCCSLLLAAARCCSLLLLLAAAAARCCSCCSLLLLLAARCCCSLLAAADALACCCCCLLAVAAACCCCCCCCWPAAVAAAAAAAVVFARCIRHCLRVRVGWDNCEIEVGCRLHNLDSMRVDSTQRTHRGACAGWGRSRDCSHQAGA